MWFALVVAVAGVLLVSWLLWAPVPVKVEMARFHRVSNVLSGSRHVLSFKPDLHGAALHLQERVIANGDAARLVAILLAEGPISPAPRALELAKDRWRVVGQSASLGVLTIRSTTGECVLAVYEDSLCVFPDGSFQLLHHISCPKFVKTLRRFVAAKAARANE